MAGCTAALLSLLSGPGGEMVMNPVPGVAGTDYPVYSSVPGVAGTDYPVYSSVPDTGFDCSQQQYPGIYTDTEAACQVGISTVS